jgi:hypothetical protein
VLLERRCDTRAVEINYAEGPPNGPALEAITPFLEQMRAT